MVRAKIKSQKFLKFIFVVAPPRKIMKNKTFGAFLETKGPRDLPCAQERQILFRIALRRALYDQMAPQL